VRVDSVSWVGMMGFPRTRTSGSWGRCRHARSTCPAGFPGPDPVLPAPDPRGRAARHGARGGSVLAREPIAAGRGAGPPDLAGVWGRGDPGGRPDDREPAEALAGDGARPSRMTDGIWFMNK